MEMTLNTQKHCWKKNNEPFISKATRLEGKNNKFMLKIDMFGGYFLRRSWGGAIFQGKFSLFVRW